MSRNRFLPSKGCSGFTLLEVLVAMSVLAISITVIMRVFSSAATSTQVMDDYYHALQLAESRMAMLLTERNPLGTDSGEENQRYRWRTVVTEYRPDSDSLMFGNSLLNDPENEFIPYHFYVSVTWGHIRERSFELDTIRLGVRN